jgi:hypothetical protein
VLAFRVLCPTVRFGQILTLEKLCVYLCICNLIHLPHGAENRRMHVLSRPKRFPSKVDAGDVLNSVFVAQVGTIASGGRYEA